MDYKALAYSEKYEDGRISGTITLTNTSLTFTSGEEVIVLYKNDVTIDNGGTANRQIFIRSKTQSHSLSTGDKTILNHPFFDHSQHLQSQKRKVVSSFRTTKIILLSGFTLISILLATAIYNRSWIVKQLASNVPYTLEQKLGASYVAQLSLMGELDSTSQALKILREKINFITSKIDQSYAFKTYISQDTTVNAFALPGGIMVFNTGLLTKAESWEEVLGVAAHEAAHVTEKHHTRGILSKFGIWTLISMAVGDGSFITDIITGAGANLEGLSYSREYEIESDTKGFEYLTKANINPKGLRSFFAKLEEENEQEITSAIPQFLSTHPSNENRIHNIQELESQFNNKEYLVFPKYDEFKLLFKNENPNCEDIK